MTKYGGDGLIRSQLKHIIQCLYPFPFSFPHTQIASKPSDCQQPSVSLVGATVNYVDLWYIYIFCVCFLSLSKNVCN